MGIPLIENNLVFSALVIGLLGIVECFFGYRVVRIVLAVLGFILGAVLATSLLNTNETVSMIIVGVIGGLIGAVILYNLYFLGTFLAGVGLGGTAATILAANLRLDPTAT